MCTNTATVLRSNTAHKQNLLFIWRSPSTLIHVSWWCLSLLVLPNAIPSSSATKSITASERRGVQLHETWRIDFLRDRRYCEGKDASGPPGNLHGPWKLGHPKRNSIFQPLIFRKYVSFLEGKPSRTKAFYQSYFKPDAGFLPSTAAVGWSVK